MNQIPQTVLDLLTKGRAPKVGVFATQKKIANNTYLNLRRSSKSGAPLAIALTFHGSDVVTFLPDRVLINAHGYEYHPSTRDRINIGIGYIRGEDYEDFPSFQSERGYIKVGRYAYSPGDNGMVFHYNGVPFDRSVIRAAKISENRSRGSKVAYENMRDKALNTGIAISEFFKETGIQIVSSVKAETQLNWNQNFRADAETNRLIYRDSDYRKSFVSVQSIRYELDVNELKRYFVAKIILFGRNYKEEISIQSVALVGNKGGLWVSPVPSHPYFNVSQSIDKIENAIRRLNPDDIVVESV